MDLSRVFFKHPHPLLDVSGSTLRVVPHTGALPRHHGADLGPQFSAGILGRSKPVRQSLFERVPVHAIRVAGRVAAFRKADAPPAPQAGHGSRSSFRDWAAEETDHPREVIEAAYARSDLECRRILMDYWSGYLAQGRATDSEPSR